MSASVKERILDAGVTLLHEQGIAALSQPKVAKAAGVSQSHLTYYFPTRNQLLLALADRSIEKIIASMTQFEQPGRPIPLQQIATHPSVINQARMMTGLMVAADTDAELRQSLNTLVVSIREKIGAALARFGFHVSAEKLLVIHSCLVGFGVLNFARQSKESADEFLLGMQTLLQLLQDTEK